MKYLPGAMLELNRKAVLLISGPLPKTAALGWGLTPATVGSYCPGPTRLFLSPVKIVPSGGGCACNCPSGVSSYLRVADTGLGFQTLLRVSDTDLGFHTQTWVRLTLGHSPFANAANVPAGSLCSGLDVMRTTFICDLAAAKWYCLQSVLMMQVVEASNDSY